MPIPDLAAAAPESPAEDMVVIQIPKAQLDAVAEGLGMLTELIMSAKEKAEADIASQGVADTGEASAADMQMIAELEAMDRGSRG